MKKLLPWLLLAGLLAVSLWNNAAMTHRTARWQDQLTSLAPLLEREDWPALSRALQSSYRDWSAHQTYLRMVTEHALLEDAESLYRRSLAFAAARDAQELRAELAELAVRLRLLAEREGFHLGNIL